MYYVDSVITILSNFLLSVALKMIFPSQFVFHIWWPETLVYMLFHFNICEMQTLKLHST